MHLDRARLQQLDVLVPPDASETLRFAADELCRYLSQMSGVALAPQRRDSLRGARLALGTAPEVPSLSSPDAFRITATPAGACLAGQSDRAVLWAVYRLLESAGCRWSFHGSAGEVVPPLSADGLRLSAVHEEPRYRIRAYSSDIHTWHYHEPEPFRAHLAGDAVFADWMGKSSANGFFLIRHPFDSQLTIPELLPEFAKRGIRPEYGGHVLPLLLPRELFASHAEYFPQDRHGRRHDLGNMCASNPAALDLVADRAVQYARDYPEMSVLHIWGADLWDGGWCHCNSCRGLSVQDQSLRVCNAVAERLQAAGLNLPACYLAYHDTIDPELSVEPHPNVLVEFAPRERCYAHALNDPTCEINPRYRRAFEGYAEKFGGRVRIFEYYGDSILFCGCAVPLAEVIEADLSYYHRIGAREITFLQFGRHSLWAYPLNFLVFAACSWGASPTASVEAYCRHFGDVATAHRYWNDLEQAMRAAVCYGDVMRPPQRRAASLLPGLEAALPVLQRWREQLAGHDALVQGPLLEYTEHVLRGVMAQLAADDPGASPAQAHYERALDALRGVDPIHLGVWGTRNLPVIHSFHAARLGEE